MLGRFCWKFPTQFSPPNIKWLQTKQFQGCVICPLLHPKDHIKRCLLDSLNISSLWAGNAGMSGRDYQLKKTSYLLYMYNFQLLNCGPQFLPSSKDPLTIIPFLDNTFCIWRVSFLLSAQLYGRPDLAIWYRYPCCDSYQTDTDKRYKLISYRYLPTDTNNHFNLQTYYRYRM